MQNRLLAGALVMAGVWLTAGCSDDDNPIPPVVDQRAQDARGQADSRPAPTEAGYKDAGPMPKDCTGKTNGDDCSPTGEPGFICMNGKCVGSSCGDKFVDAKMGEECDDTTAGCSACKFACKAATDCVDAEQCNGAETCDTTKHTCSAGANLPDADPCKLAGGTDGVCKAGVCVTQGCGNKTVEAPEQCDDGNTVDGDGCNNNCKWSCEGNLQCNDQNACNGTETCDTHVCVAGVTPSCNDSKACTTDSCDPKTGCVYTAIDLDKDGKSCDLDCNDNDPSIWVNAPECADGKDNDCDKAADEPPLTSGKCWVDKDKDSFALAAAATIIGCTCPVGYTSRDPAGVGQADCSDGNASVFPGQTQWFTSSYCTAWKPVFPPVCLTKSFDYNCSKVDEKHWDKSAPGSTCALFWIGVPPTVKPVCFGEGWLGAVPNCEVEAKFRVCTLAGTTTKTCLASEVLRKQECH